MFSMAERSDGCSGQTLLAPCTRKKRLQRKMTNDYYLIGVQENTHFYRCMIKIVRGRGRVGGWGGGSSERCLKWGGGGH